MSLLLMMAGARVATPPTVAVEALLPALGPIPAQTPIVGPGGLAADDWIRQLGEMNVTLDLLRPVSIDVDTPMQLSHADAGDVYHVKVFNHLVQWTGTAWQFAPADQGNGWVQFFSVPPSTDGWAPCDGTSTTILTVGATLGEQTVVTPVITSAWLRR